MSRLLHQQLDARTKAKLQAAVINLMKLFGCMMLQYGLFQVSTPITHHVSVYLCHAIGMPLAHRQQAASGLAQSYLQYLSLPQGSRTPLPAQADPHPGNLLLQVRLLIY